MGVVVDYSFAIRRFVLFVVLVFCATCNANDIKEPESEDALYWWTYYGVDSQLHLRAIVSQESVCPDLLVGGNPVKLLASIYDELTQTVKVCDVVIPDKDFRSTVMFNGEVVHKPSSTIKNIMVVGDTGCVSSGWIRKQDCKNEWYLSRIVEAASVHDIDLIIHAGDISYISRCSGNSCADDDVWSRWSYEFFEPFAPLLKKAPWVFVRGNHESCKRAGKEWFFFLDQNRQNTDRCVDVQDPHLLSFDNLQLANIDSSYASDFFISWFYRSKQKELLAAKNMLELDSYNNDPSRLFLLLTHRPVWGLRYGIRHTNYNLQKTIGDIALRSDGIISGHLHQFEFLDFEDGLAPQIISGNGGAAANPRLFSLNNFVGSRFGKRILRKVYGFYDYGYTIISLDFAKNNKNKAILRHYNMQGKVQFERKLG